MKNYLSQRSFKLIIFLIFFGSCYSVSSATEGENSVIAPLATHSLLLDIKRADSALIAVGERGHILISEDNGNSWQQQLVPTRATLTGVYFPDRLHGYAVGHDQVILRTRNGGVSWELLYEDIEAETPLLDLYFLDQQHGFAIGAYGLFLETFDAGNSWSKRFISEDDLHLNKIIKIGDSLFIAAEAGVAYRSDDDGENWISLTPDYNGSFFGILPITGDRLLLYGLRGHLFHSEDAGETWEQIEKATEASLTAGLRLNDGRIVIAGMAGVLLVSDDDGQSFELQQDPERRGYSSLLQSADGAIVAVGDFGVTRFSQTSLLSDK